MQVWTDESRGPGFATAGPFSSSPTRRNWSAFLLPLSIYFARDSLAKRRKMATLYVFYTPNFTGHTRKP